MLQRKVLDEDRPTAEEQSPQSRWELSPEAKAHARQYKIWGNPKKDLSRPFLLRPSGYGGQAGTSSQRTIRTP